MNPVDRLTAFVRAYLQTRDAGGDFTALDEEAATLLEAAARLTRQGEDHTLAALWAAATDNEADTVTDLAVRAGLLWRCRFETSGRSCGYINPITADRCEECGAAPGQQDEPEAE